MAIFAGGGTGGHLFPGLAVAEQLARGPTPIPSRFLCSTRAIDARILAGATLDRIPVRFEPIPAFPPSARPLALYRFVTNWGVSVRTARAAIRAAAATHGGRAVVVAMGGFVAAPVVQAARAERIPAVMVNLDATPGRANRWIGARVPEGRIVTTAAVPARPRWRVITPIVRAAALAPAPPEECRRRLGLDPERPTLLVTGASQGAATINRFLEAFVRAHASDLRGWQVIHQTGDADEGAGMLARAYRQAGVPALVTPFLEAMGLAWGAATAAVSRAGAGSVAEAWANGVPTVFLPYPFHADQHQKRNAQPLVDAGAALLAEDRIAPEATLSSAGPALRSMLEPRGAALAGMRRCLAGLPRISGAVDVARLVQDALRGMFP